VVTNHLRRRRTYGHDDPGFPVPFVVGAPRSGTTLLRLMLDAHPEVAIPSETHFIPEVVGAFRRHKQSADQLMERLVVHKRWGDFHLEPDDLRARLAANEPLNAADAIRTFYRLYAERQGKPRWGDKTPGYVKDMRLISRVLPESRFIHILRDGRDVALSVIPMSWGPDTVARAAEVWRERILKARAQVPHLPHYIEVHYEELVLDTEAVLRRVCEFIELEFDPVMLAYHERAADRLREKERDLPRRKKPPQPAAARMASHALAKQPPQADRVARWRNEMSSEDVAEYETVAGDLLAQLGYERATEMEGVR
jgi:hypothetical protein